MSEIMEVYTTFLDTNTTVKSIQGQRTLTKAIKKTWETRSGFGPLLLVPLLFIATKSPKGKL